MHRAFIIIAALLAGLVTALIGGCRSDAPSKSASGTQVKDTTELKAAFNADAGKVRVVVLASPT